MIDYIKKQIIKHQKILKYLCCSGATALFEVVLGWFLLRLMSQQIVFSNTVSIIAGAIIHYFLTLMFVFKKENSYKSFLVYGISFLIGIFLQDAIIWLFYDMILADQSIMVIRYGFSKGLSLVVPFLAIYYIRNFLYKKIK